MYQKTGIEETKAEKKNDSQTYILTYRHILVLSSLPPENEPSPVSPTETLSSGLLPGVPPPTSTAKRTHEPSLEKNLRGQCDGNTVTDERHSSKQSG